MKALLEHDAWSDEAADGRAPSAPLEEEAA